MDRFFDRIEFLISEAFVALRRNALMTFAAISTTAVALFLIGGLGYVYTQLNKSTEAEAGRFEMRVFLKDGTKRADIQEMAKALRGINGVAKVVLIPKEAAWQKYKEEHDQAMTAGIDNPLPDSFKIVLTDVSKAPAVKDEIVKMPEVLPENGVQFMQEVQELMSGLRRLIRWLGVVLGGLLLVTGGILIYNAIRLAIISRRREIRIMQLVGASHFTVQTPFILEGAIQGFLGGAIASLLLWPANIVVERYVHTNLSNVKDFPAFPLWNILYTLGFVGAVYGVLCSILAVREPLRYRTKVHL